MPNFPLSSRRENRLAPTRTTTPYLRTAPIQIANYFGASRLFINKSKSIEMATGGSNYRPRSGRPCVTTTAGDNFICNNYLRKYFQSALENDREFQRRGPVFKQTV